MAGKTHPTVYHFWEWREGVAWDNRYAPPPIQPDTVRAIYDACGPIRCQVEGCNNPSAGHSTLAELDLCESHFGKLMGNRPARFRRGEA